MRKKFYLHSIELLEDIRFFLLIPRDFLSQVRGLLLPPFCFSRLLRNNAVQGDCSNEKLSCPGLSPGRPGYRSPQYPPRTFFVPVIYSGQGCISKQKRNKRDYLCIFLKTISFFSLTNLRRTSGNSLRTADLFPVVAS